jgi:hypothetical protein
MGWVTIVIAGFEFDPRVTLFFGALTTGFTGFVLVWVGAWTAPKEKFFISIILVGLFFLPAGYILMKDFSAPDRESFHFIVICLSVGLIGAVAACNLIYKKGKAQDVDNEVIDINDLLARKTPSCGLVAGPGGKYTMANSKEAPQGKKSSKKLFKWGLMASVASAIIVIIYLVFITPHPPGRHYRSDRPERYYSPDGPANRSLRNLVTVLETYYADHKKFPQPDKVTSFRPELGVTAFFILTSRDEQHYFAVAFNTKAIHTKEGSRLYVKYSDSPRICWIPFPKEGLVKAEPL